VEIVALRASPVYWGIGVPRGDGSAVVVLPGFLGTDLYLVEFRSWLRRIGYRPYVSNIGWNAECPNLLIQRRLKEVMDTAFRESGRKIHLVGHSLGGMIARAAATQMPDRVASVITLGSPFMGLAAHPSILRAAELVREQILERHGEDVLPDCYTGACTCDFLESLAQDVPPPVMATAIYTKADGIVSWEVCKSGRPEVDVEVNATHLGLAFNPNVYCIVARRLAGLPANW
jgi:pimeloyl-ACP methyl ester carboxylesterase